MLFAELGSGVVDPLRALSVAPTGRRVSGHPVEAAECAPKYFRQQIMWCAMTAFWQRSQVPAQASGSVHEAPLLPTRRQTLLGATNFALLRDTCRGDKVCQHRECAKRTAAQIAIQMTEHRYWTRFKGRLGAARNLRFTR